MIDSATTRLVDDEAPTTVDGTVRTAADLSRRDDEGRAVNADWKSRLKNVRLGWLLGAALGVLLLGGSLGAFIRQRAVSTRLRRELALLEREYEASRTGTRMGLESRLATPAKGRSFEAEKLTREQLELHAVEALVDSNFTGALGYYQELSERAPEESVYSDFVSVLRTKSICSEPMNGEVVTCP